MHFVEMTTSTHFSAFGEALLHDKRRTQSCPTRLPSGIVDKQRHSLDGCMTQLRCSMRSDEQT